MMVRIVRIVQDPFGELEIKAYRSAEGRLLFGSSTPDGVVWLEQTFPAGRWCEDEDGRPLFDVGKVESLRQEYQDPLGPSFGPPRLWFDYDVQAWIEDGKVAKCGHTEKHIGCYACYHVGQTADPSHFRKE